MNLDKISRKLSFLLRHCQAPQYIDLNGGWAPVGDMLAALNITRAQLDEIVAGDRKGRYSYDGSGARIRANQGHSIPGVVLDMERPQPPEYLYHGTATRFLDSIFREGLKPMSRLWVHLSADYETAVTVGRRHGKPLVLRIRARELNAAGYPLCRSTNGVWQVKAVPPEFFQVCHTEEE